QIVQIKAISGTQVTIDPPVYFDHKAELAPQAFWWAGGNMDYAGLENLTVDGANITDHVIKLHFCTDCWVSGVEVKNTPRSAINVHWYSFRAEIRDTY